MDEKPTVQMDPHEEEPWRREADTPPTIPIDDIFEEQEWPSPAQQQPSPPSPQTPSADKTVIMKPAFSASLLAWLAVTEGPGASRGQIFPLQQETVIGRKVGQIVLSGDAYVSGQHAKIRLERSEENEEKQVFVLYDLASANGTFVGDRKDYRDNQIYRHELEDGDFILIGETTLVFKQVRLGAD